MKLEKITAIVTGAGGGLGRALCFRLAEVCNVYPGPLDTDLIRTSTTTDADRLRREADFVRLKAIPMERVTNRIIRAIQSNATRVRIGRETYLIDWALRLFPRWTYTLLARFMHKIDFV